MIFVRKSLATLRTFWYAARKSALNDLGTPENTRAPRFPCPFHRLRPEDGVYFDLEKDTPRPFVIEAVNTLVTVLGTKFIVDTRAGTVYVREGKVRVETGKASVILTANQKVSINDQSLSAVSTDNCDHADMWFNEDLIFNNSPFDKVITDIEKAFGIKIQLPSGRDWTKCTFTSGSLKNNRIEDIMTTLKVTYDLEYTQKDSHNYKISRLKCR